MEDVSAAKKAFDSRVRELAEERVNAKRVPCKRVRDSEGYVVVIKRFLIECLKRAEDFEYERDGP